MFYKRNMEKAKKEAALKVDGKYDRAAIMKMAWEKARNEARFYENNQHLSGASKFKGMTARDFFSQELKKVWAIAKAL